MSALGGQAFGGFCWGVKQVGGLDAGDGQQVPRYLLVECWEYNVLWLSVGSCKC